MIYFLITEWNYDIGVVIKGGDHWEKTHLFELPEEDVWEYVLAAMTDVALGRPRPHFSVKELTSKMSTRSIEGKVVNSDN